MKVSLVQTNPQPDRARNLDETRALMEEAYRAEGPDLIVLPEYFEAYGLSVASWPWPSRLAAQPDGQRLRPRAPRVRPCRHHHGKGRERGAYLEHVLRVRSIGREVAAYRKIHMFDIVAPDGSVYRESDSVKPGGRS